MDKVLPPSHLDRDQCTATSISASSSDSDNSSHTSSSSSSSSSARHWAPKLKKRRQNYSRTRPSKERAPWHIMLSLAGKGINSIADENSPDGRYFRRRFRLPYALFEGLVQVMLADNWFPAEYESNGRGKVDRRGVRGCSLQVKFLSLLRVLGRVVCFDELFVGLECIEVMMSRIFPKFLKTF